MRTTAENRSAGTYIITGAYASGSDAVDNSYAGRVSALTTAAQTAQETVDKNSIVKDLAAIKDTNSEEYKAALSKLVDEVDAAYDLSSSAQYNTDASKIDGKDAEIELNGVKYTGSKQQLQHQWTEHYSTLKDIRQ